MLLIESAADYSDPQLPKVVADSIIAANSALAAMDATAEFEAARDALRGSGDAVARDIADGHSKARSLRQQKVPGGRHVVKRAQAMMAPAGECLYGHTIEGAGKGGTVIAFEPENEYDVTGACQGGSTTTQIVLSASASAANGAYIGWTVTPTSGPASGQTRTIVAYNGTTKTAAISPGDAMPSAPDAGDTYGLAAPLFSSDNRFYGLVIRGITFTCTSNKRNLFSQWSNGTAQDITFEHCEFEGDWNDLVHLSTANLGTGNNSEILFSRCSFYGRWRAALAMSMSGQQLNYWFTNCKYWTTRTWVRGYQASHITIRDCDVSGYGFVNAPNDMRVNPVYLFKLGGVSVVRGHFAIDGMRMECHSPDARLLKSEWTNGAITLARLKMAKEGSYGDSNALMMDVDQENFGTTFAANNSELLGLLQFNYAGEGYRLSPIHTLNNCTHAISNMPDQFIAWSTPDSNGSTAGRPQVLVNGWHSTIGVLNRKKFLGDGLVNGRGAQYAGRRNFIAHFATRYIATPGSDTPAEIRLPLGALVTGARAYWPAGATVDASPRTFSIKTADSLPVALFDMAVAKPSAGASIKLDGYFQCETESNSTLRLTSSPGTPEIAGGIIAVDYIA